jgi:hypothetical protein
MIFISPGVASHPLLWQNDSRKMGEEVGNAVIFVIRAAGCQLALICQNKKWQERMGK